MHMGDAVAHLDPSAGPRCPLAQLLTAVSITRTVCSGWKLPRPDPWILHCEQPAPMAGLFRGTKDEPLSPSQESSRGSFQLLASLQDWPGPLLQLHRISAPPFSPILLSLPLTGDCAPKILLPHNFCKTTCNNISKKPRLGNITVVTKCLSQDGLIGLNFL